MTDLEVLRETFEVLTEMDCTFGCCDGPEHPEYMKTCSKCWLVHDIAEHLKQQQAGGTDG